MSELRIGCGLASSVMPILRIDVASSCKEEEKIILHNLFKIIELSSFYKAKLISPDEELIPKIDDDYPIGTACLLEFKTHNDAMNFIRDLKPY